LQRDSFENFFKIITTLKIVIETSAPIAKTKHSNSHDVVNCHFYIKIVSVVILNEQRMIISSELSVFSVGIMVII